jgi:hypothetical protein
MTAQKQVDVNAVLDYEVAADGSHVRLNLANDQGNPVDVALPIECLKQLVLSMPVILEQTLRALYQNPALRLVHTVKLWTIERASDPQALILSFKTPDHFSISFRVDQADILRMADSFIDHEADAYPLGLRVH